VRLIVIVAARPEFSVFKRNQPTPLHPRHLPQVKSEAMVVEDTGDSRVKDIASEFELDGLSGPTLKGSLGPMIVTFRTGAAHEGNP
jgi:hypothetical protein